MLEYLFKPMPDGYLSSRWENTTALIHVSFFFTVTLPLLWISVNIDELSRVAMLYLMMGVWSEIIAITERLSPEKIPWSYLAVRRENFLYQTLSGIALGIAVTFIGADISSFVPFTIASATQASNLLKIYLWAYGFMAVEESLFSQWLAATLCEKTGLIPGATITALVFSAFHWSLYGWSTQILISLFVFRFLGSIVNAAYRSMVPSATAHVIINLLALRALGVL